MDDAVGITHSKEFRLNHSPWADYPTSRSGRLGWIVWLVCVAGCAGERPDDRLATDRVKGESSVEQDLASRRKPPLFGRPQEATDVDDAAETATRVSLQEAGVADPGETTAADPAVPREDDSLATLLLSDTTRELLDRGPDIGAIADRPPVIDERAVVAEGIRRIDGKHLTLYTDAPPRLAIDQIPEVFDAAVLQWCAYFGVAPDKVADWKMIGYHIVAKERHQQAALFPANLPPFLHGYHRGSELWVYEQPSDYYRRHLVLHEGVHGFMSTFLGGTGPPWYSEGMAEYLATHRWHNHELVIARFPMTKEEVPYWGRIKVIQDEFAAGRGMMLSEIMRYDRAAHLRLEPYAWCWAAVAFLDNHPVYRNRFRQLIGKVSDSTIFFTRDFEAQLQDRKRELDEEWQVFVINIDYGYDFVRNMIQYAPGLREPGEGQTVTIAADRGWQSTGLKLEAGKSYRIEAEGRFKIRQRPEVWWCEPGGITLEYAHGHPLGLLMGNIRLDVPQPGVANLGTPIAVGQKRRFVAAGEGTLYLKVNERGDGLADNAGQITVKVTEGRESTGKTASRAGAAERPD